MNAITPPHEGNKVFQSNLTQSQRGVFTQKALRRSLATFLETHGAAYYSLTTVRNNMNVLVSAEILLPLLTWLTKYPKLRCDITFLPKRKPLTTGHRNSVAALSDGDVLAISRITFLTAKLTLHIYDKQADGTYLTRRLGAPMRTLSFEGMSKPYIGFQKGKPPVAISKVPFQHEKLDIETILGPIDVVYTWVDSQDPSWQQRFAARVGKPSQSTVSSELRYLSRDELRYSLRSIRRYAPWVRNIYIVTDDQTPAWFVGDAAVKIVSHRDIFPDTSVLPVFNSHAIESCLHRIPGLSEHFIYFNDDVFLGKRTKPTDFFTAKGEVRMFFSSRLSFNDHWIGRGTLPTDAAFRNTIEIIESRFGFTPTSKVMHTPHPCLLYTSPSPRDQRGSRMPSSA